MPRPKKETPVMPKAPISASKIEMFIPPTIFGDIRLLAQVQRRPLESQVIVCLELGIQAEKDNRAKLNAPPPPPPPPPKPAPRPIPAPMSYQAIRALAHNAIDQLKLRVTADDLPYLLAELSRYAVACRSLLLLGPAIDEEDDD